MITAVITAYAAAGVFLIAAIRLHLERRYLIRHATQRTERTVRNEAIANWAERTMLNVVNVSGKLYATTLAELWGTHRPDHTWISPIYVSVWHGTDDQIAQYRAEMDHTKEHPRG
jgi:hypothetical protein